MEKIDALEEKIKNAIKTIRSLREKNGLLDKQYRKLEEENELLHSENRQVRTLMSELDRLREERTLARQKCERLLLRLQKTSL